MELSPALYHRFIRPRWFSKLYIDNILSQSCNFTDKKVLDFGSGIGSASSLFKPSNYIGLEKDCQRTNYARRLHPGYRFEVLQDDEITLPPASVDYILIIAVLHHIPTEKVFEYLPAFHRILKTAGKILVIEPCFQEACPLNNWFMKSFDNGKYIRSEPEYLKLFEQLFQTKVAKRFNKLLYNEIFFSATPK